VKYNLYVFAGLPACLWIANIRFEDFDSSGKVLKIFAFAVREVVDNADGMAQFDEPGREVRADEARSAGYE
jgi:hypothetical protein